MRAIMIVTVLMGSGVAYGQTDAPPGAGASPAMPMAGTRPGLAPSFVPASPAVPLYNDAMKTMMANMGKPYSGDPDADFVSHMIPHHQGAIDMAEIELKYGADPKLKQLAARIIAAQQREIAFMQAWAARHQAKPALPLADPHRQVK